MIKHEELNKKGHLQNIQPTENYIDIRNLQNYDEWSIGKWRLIFDRESLFQRKKIQKQRKGVSGNQALKSSLDHSYKYILQSLPLFNKYLSRSNRI